MSNSLLLAVPFFILMGTLLEKSKLAEDLLVTIGFYLEDSEGAWLWLLSLLGHYWLQRLV